MTRTNYLWIDQQGNQFQATSIRQLRKQIPGRVSPMYVDTKSGKTLRVGVVIGKHWLRQFAPVTVVTGR